MNPVRFFAIQTCKTSRPQGLPGGGIPELTPDEAAHYCQGMLNHWYLAAKLKWADDWSGVNELEYKLWDEAVRLRNRERWRIEKKYEGQEMLRKLAGLALWEMGEPSRFKHDSAWQLRAQWMGLEKGAWYKTWNARYEAVYEILSEWCNDAWRHVKKQKAQEQINGD